MNTELNDALLNIANATTKKGSELVDWLYQQVPDIINQLLIWKCTESVINCIFGLLLVIGIPCLLHRIFKKIHSHCQTLESYERDNCYIPFFIFGSIGLIVSQLFGWFLVNVIWLKILVAPKVFLLEYMSHLIK